MFQKYLDAGLCVIPLKNGIPAVKWSQYQQTKPTQTDIKGWDKFKEYALVCGKVSGVIALDIDTDDVAIIEQIESIAGVSPVCKIGSKGYTGFYRYNGEKTQNWGGVCELLSDKHLTTLPPSKHREKNLHYEWHEGCELIDATLPALPADFLEKMDLLYPKPIRHEPRIEYTERTIELQEAENMLSFISPDCKRDEWVKIGMALRDEYGDMACGLWHHWSSKSAKYKVREAQSTWQSFHGNGITIGTLVQQALNNGFHFEPAQQSSGGFEVDLSYLYDAKPKAIEPIKIHGLVGEIADWITATAIRPQPVLSLAAAITFMGMVKGHRIKNRVQGARTNILTLSLAPTGGGKEHPQISVDRLAEACGLGSHLMGRPTSGTALLTGLNKTGGVALLQVDEMGRYISNITAKSAGGFQREIADYMVELFSCANKIFRGRQYANDKLNPQIIINQPHFCCMGSTVPERLKAACGSSEVIDGFLNRWLVFAAEGRPEKQLGVKFAPPPENLVESIKNWLSSNPITTDSYGNSDPKEVGFTPEAWDIFTAFDKETHKKLETEPYPINELYVRSAEHVIKLAMVICDDDFIGVHDIQAAITIVRQSNEQIAIFASGITDNQHESDVVFLLETIKNHPGITRNQLTQRTRRLGQKVRGDILNQLIEAESIKYSIDGKRISYFPL